MLLVGAIGHMFAEEDRVFLPLCIMVYGIINKGLMYTAGSSICCGKAKPSVLLNEVNIGSVMGLLVCFSGDLIGFDLLPWLHSPRNWLDIAGLGKTVGMMANPLLQMSAGAALSKGPKSEDLDGTAIIL